MTRDVSGMGGAKQGQRHGQRPFWRKRWFVITAGIFLLLLIIGALSGDPEQESDNRAARQGDATATPTRSATPDPAQVARAEAAALAKDSDYVAAVDVLEDAGLTGAADRVRRRGTRALLVAARRALEKGRYEVAKANAIEARQLQRTGAVRSVLAAANAGITRERAEARERRRQARIARDLRTCSSVEKDTVRAGAGVPAGCQTFAADLAARRAEEEAQQAASQCDPNYAGACLDPNSADYDCEGGSGDGPDYTGTVRVVGADPYDLDRDGDGVACDT
jgi:hypothetical protein